MPVPNLASEQQITGGKSGNLNGRLARGIWSEAIWILWQVKWVAITTLAAIAAAFYTLKAYGFEDYATPLTPLIIVPLAFTSQARILTGNSSLRPLALETFKSIWFPYAWRSLVLFLIGAAPAFAVQYLPMGQPNPLLVVAILMATYAILESLVMAKFGTILPACITGGNRTIQVAGTRGRMTFRYVLLRFWVFNGLTLLVSYLTVTSIYATVVAIVHMAMGTTDYGSIRPIFEILLGLPLVLSGVMCAVISARAYLIAEDKLKEALALASAS